MQVFGQHFDDEPLSGSDVFRCLPKPLPVVAGAFLNVRGCREDQHNSQQGARVLLPLQVPCQGGDNTEFLQDCSFIRR